ncbi:MAG: Asp-tRNA(Asn)/Glu-tRNA(Gln) amidotransferase subunit GatB [Chitinispirillaceae bacterium]|nr:Asp-tRNA(Asn)/Glu-tRNA(Gln) amidotransferase subunit GatB [Chitinispirillaceae bacterium]
MDFETVIGLEIHARLLTETKLFCGCRSRFGDPANTNGCPVCLGLPGALPVLNRRAVAMAIRMGCAIGCAIAERSLFVRKHYFYPDLPKGYQISQHDTPLGRNGKVPMVVDGALKAVGVTRIHLEEDAGKLIHDRGPESLFDVNRCGTPLIEIVSEPDLRSPHEAYVFFSGIKAILEYLGICDCIMEEGSLRCDANISLRLRGETNLGTKTEIKNMNSFRGVKKALEYEARRQEEVLRGNGKILQETFLWDPNADRVISMRSKEEVHDYRYFPEPDLPPLTVTLEEIAALRKTLPELPAQRCKRFVGQMGLQEYPAEILTSSKKLADFFEATLAVYPHPRKVANRVIVDILRIINELNISVDQLKVTPSRLGSLLKLIDNGTISAGSVRKILDLMQERDQDPECIIDDEGLRQLSDSHTLESVVRSVLAQNPDEVERFRAGEKKLLGFFVGEAMKATKGSGNPEKINALLTALLG